MEKRLHDLGVPGDFLLVAGGERFDLQIGEQALGRQDSVFSRKSSSMSALGCR
jgi:hypothetical protein